MCADGVESKDSLSMRRLITTAPAGRQPVKREGIERHAQFVCKGERLVGCHDEYQNLAFKELERLPSWFH